MAYETREVKTLYGPRKIGAEAFAKQQAEQKLSTRANTVYGSKKGDPAPTAPATPADPPKPPAGPRAGDKDAKPASLEALEKSLTRRPALLDAAIAAELKTAKPRKGALELFVKVEKSRKGGPRAEVLAQLEQALTPATS